MINSIINTINERLTGFTQLYCLLERREGDTVEYSGGGSFNSIPFDEHAVGGYWRLRSSVTIDERPSTVACNKIQDLTYPLYFVAWFDRDEIDGTVDEFIHNTVGIISTLRTPQVKTNVRGVDLDRQEDESGKSADRWVLLRFDVDVVFTKVCKTECEVVADECVLNGSINSESIGQFFSDFNIIVENEDGDEVGEWDGEKWVVPNSGGETYTLSIPQAPYLEDVLANMIVLIQDDAGVDLADPLVGLNVDGNTLEVMLADYGVAYYYEGGAGREIFSISRRFDPRIYPRDSAGNLLPEPTFVQVDNEITATYGDIELTLNDVAFLGLLLSLTDQDISLIDQYGADITPTDVTDAQITVLTALAVVLTSDEYNPTAGEQITLTATSANADSFCFWLGNGASISGLSNTGDYTYLLPGIYTPQVLVADSSNGAGGQNTIDTDITVAGILDTYGSSALAVAPWLLKRLYGGDWMQVQETGGSTNALIGYTDGLGDTAALLAHTGANDGLVRQLLFQDSGGLTLQQTTAANMPVIVDAGTLITDIFRVPTIRFNGTTHRMTAANPAFWGANRTKLASFFVAKCTGSSATHPLLAQYNSTGNQRSFVFFFDGANGRVGVRWSSDGSAIQTVLFDTTVTSVQGYFVQIDTTLTGNARARVWVTNQNGTTELTVNAGASSGNVSGNIFASTADLEYGSFVNGAALFQGESGGFGIDPSLWSTTDREALQDYFQLMLQNYPS